MTTIVHRRDDGTEVSASFSEFNKLKADCDGLRAFAEFALKWCDRGPPHGGPGREAEALDLIRHHPVLSAMRRSVK